MYFRTKRKSVDCRNRGRIRTGNGHGRDPKPSSGRKSPRPKYMRAARSKDDRQLVQGTEWPSLHVGNQT
jgi:hypothetical protein